MRRYGVAMSLDSTLLPFFSRDAELVVRHMPKDSVPYAMFKRALPTPSEIEMVRQKGYGLFLLDPPSPDLLITRQFPGLTHLSVTTGSIDTSALSEMHHLRELHLSIGRAPTTDLSRLGSLRLYSGAIEGFESVLQAPSLEVATFHEVGTDALPPIPRQLKELTIMGARRLRQLQLGSGDSQPELHTLVIDGPRRFDASSLREFTSLAKVFFMSVVHLASADSLVAHNLTLLSLRNCREVPDIEVLAKITGTQVYVTGKLADSVRELGSQADPPWTIARRD
jgi:hypothetical protein